jgi:hypothetical protein
MLLPDAKLACVVCASLVRAIELPLELIEPRELAVLASERAWIERRLVAAAAPDMERHPRLDHVHEAGPDWRIDEAVGAMRGVRHHKFVTLPFLTRQGPCSISVSSVEAGN